MKEDVKPLIKGMLSGFIILIIVMAILILATSCSQKVHRPRYNHWAKPYKMYAPVKAHKPHVK